MLQLWRDSFFCAGHPWKVGGGVRNFFPCAYFFHPPLGGGGGATCIPQNDRHVTLIIVAFLCCRRPRLGDNWGGGVGWGWGGGAASTDRARPAFGLNHRNWATVPNHLPFLLVRDKSALGIRTMFGRSISRPLITTQRNNVTHDIVSRCCYDKTHTFRSRPPRTKQNTVAALKHRISTFATLHCAARALCLDLGKLQARPEFLRGGGVKRSPNSQCLPVLSTSGDCGFGCLRRVCVCICRMSAPPPCRQTKTERQTTGQISTW